MLLYHCCFHFDKTHFPLPVQRLLRSFIVQFTASFLCNTWTLSCGTIPQTLPSLSLFFGRLISMKTSGMVPKNIYVRSACYHAVCVRP